MIGWDVVGVVEAPARDGSGPAKGTRVVGISRRMQGWAELIALPTTDIAAIPDKVSDADAATLPVAGLTALYALERCERLLASRVLITGATGGVGYFACQLARLMGAHVTAVLRRTNQEALAKSLGVARDGDFCGRLRPRRRPQVPRHRRRRWWSRTRPAAHPPRQRRPRDPLRRQRGPRDAVRDPRSHADRRWPHRGVLPDARHPDRDRQARGSPD